MRTLVIHAPDEKARLGAASFEQIMSSGIGPGYAVSLTDVGRLAPQSAVVLLRKDRRRARAEGRLVRLAATGQYTRNGRERYDVHVQGLQLVSYRPEKLTRFGYCVL